ncbi:MAG: phenylalanine--tRNA ligase subunit beta [Anaerolineae bacterium]|nr:phenylalanine--tRNA ligase subunit beta [Anaerolineae bacterium]MCX8066913.1 phenylalanine--tRNA ligase subunit beta [Anaerolineae bacterium]MDW7990696.1 phenylalanine--tRNA ligase subunit beta [Anaerolineae bacterium]
MRVPLSWLKDYVEITVPIPQLAQRLTLAGLEVEKITYIGLPGAELPWDPDKIVVGEVRAVHPHPNADRLVLAEVEYGGPEIEVVVTGAPSLLARRGQTDLHLKVAFALEGAHLYDGHAPGFQVMKLKSTKIRGIPSRAMVCSEKELGLSDEHEDIIYLPDDAPVGVPLVEYLGDAVLEFDIKGPFAHLYSVFGVAREVSALLDVPLRREPLRAAETFPAQLSTNPDFVYLEIADPDLCPRYSAAFIRGVRVAPSPFWMQMRLRLAGMRPISNVVDITNYVMLELGQPLHAFDYTRLRPRPGDSRPAIIVRRARPGEQMTTLDGILRTFDREMLLITDGGGPVAVAGVMGGLESEVTQETTDVLLESANFHFLSIRRTSRLLGLSSEASQRFGRQVDPELTVPAALRAALLMAQLAGGTVVPVVGDLYPGRQPRRVLELLPTEVTRILGVEISTEEMVRILSSLDFAVQQREDGCLQVTVPSHRPDVTRPVDLVEEIARIWGYDRFPTTLLRDELPPQRPNPRLECAERVRDLLVGCGLDEVITYSLVDIADEGKLRPQGPPPDPSCYLRLKNPLSADRAYLRQTLLSSLLQTLRDNLRFQERVAIFEIGAVYLPVEGEPLPQEPLRLGVVMAGPREPRSWLPDRQSAPFNFYDLKGVVEALLSGLGLTGTFERGQHPAFHPGRCAQVSVNGTFLGVMGEIHPLVREAFDLPEGLPVCALEFDLEVLIGLWGAPRRMTPISMHPPVYEDLAVVVDEEVPAVRVRDMILQTGAPLVRSAVLFDVYRGEQIGAGKKSLAYRLTYQADDRTLVDQEVARVREKIIRRLERELGAILRGRTT